MDTVDRVNKICLALARWLETDKEYAQALLLELEEMHKVQV
ncbi:unnamed protein product [Protopolystoma xenopodis]|uniref:Uncharacterized protein n=1 Tax=Protopolystoma xenopodis TaxID=117903 RepID=A0A448XPZ6_9PLAT|nr:unnamed protein product [Protopolystoma xenopodis]